MGWRPVASVHVAAAHLHLDLRPIGQASLPARLVRPITIAEAVADDVAAVRAAAESITETT